MNSNSFISIICNPNHQIIIINLFYLSLQSIESVKIASRKKPLIIMECNRDSQSLITTSLLFIDKLDGDNIRWNTLHVSGSEKQKKTFIDKISK